MYKMKKSIFAKILLVTLLTTGIFSNNLLAQEVSTIENSAGNKENTEEIVQEAQEEEVSEASPFQEEQQVEPNEVQSNPVENSVQENVMSNGLINYVSIDQPYLFTPDEQNIVVSFGSGTENITSAKLLCEKETGEVIEFQLSRKEMDLYLFERTFEEQENGIYKLKNFVYYLDEQEVEVVLADTGVNAMFGVNQTYPGYNDGSDDIEVNLEEIELSVVDVKTNEIVEAEAEITETIEAVAAEVTAKSNDTMKSRARSARKDTVVVLDPGHGGSENGASGYGLSEKNVNLRIAQYCKEELEQYSGITVYMTRYDDTYVGLSERVQRAKSWGADIFVSLHNNAGVSSANGAEVWYPNSSYNAAIHSQGAGLSTSILNELVGLGLANRGIKIRNSDNGSKYPDGSISDYYTVINESKENGFPGIIVEHGFLSNPNDAAKLSQDSFLKQLGIADAAGIANYFGLSKNPTVEIINKNDFENSCQIKYSGCGKGAAVAVWSEVGGQDDLRWYYESGGSGVININYDEYKSSKGKYIVHVYNENLSKKLCETTFRVSGDTRSTVKATSIDNKEIQFEVELKFADMPDEVVAVQFPIWNKVNQSDIIWHNAKQVSNGIWRATININDYKSTGRYQVHSYAVLKNGKLQSLNKSQMEVSTPIANSKVENYNEKAGTFDVVVDQIKSPSGVSSIQVPVWCAADQSDIKWYEAVKQSNNTYKAHISISNHRYSVGSYKIHTYITTGNGIFMNVNKTTQEVKLSEMEASVKDKDGKQTLFQLSITNPGMYGVIRNVQFATWSEAGGQDDIIWYQGSKTTSGAWEAVADIRNHKTSGKYAVHIYATMLDGSLRLLKKISFEVSPVTVSEVAIKNYSKEKGTFDVVVKGISSPSEVSHVNVPIWCAADQSDIKWYGAERQSDGTYQAQARISNHKYSTGTYKIHTYVTAGNGIFMNVNKTTQEVELPEIEANVTDKNGKQTEYQLKVSNTGMLGLMRNVQFATWSELGGQDDIIWYQGSQITSGVWEATADIRNHRTSGKYAVHIYATMSDGTLRLLKKISFEVAAVSVSGVEVKNYNKDKGTFDVVVKEISSLSGVSQINVPVWCAADQSDIVWYSAEKQKDDTYKTQVSIANHKYATGIYKIHTYVAAGNGIFMNVNKTTQGVEVPKTEITVEETNGKEINYRMKATNVGVFGVTRNVQFATWSESGGQDDIIWYQGAQTDMGTWVATADIRNHRTSGKYSVHVYVTLLNGTLKLLGKTSFVVSDVKALSVTESNYSADIGSFKVTVSGINSVSGIKEVHVPVWSKANQGDIKWYIASKQSDGSYAAFVDPMYHQYNSGTYIVHAYVQAENGVYTFVGSTQQKVSASKYYTIVGDTNVTASQMVKYYQSSGRSYPSAKLGVGGAASIEMFCQLYIEEANAEGIRAEVAFTQAMKETGWLQYGGIVKVEQFNFAGIGALDGNSTGNCASFPDVRTGIRAQIQHLKAYGSTNSLNNPCVDPRFNLVGRGTSLFVEWLGIPDNPYGKGWATAQGYGYSIVNMIKNLKFM